MYDHILHQMRDKIRADEYIVPDHAYEELQDDDLSILDSEHIILTGRIVERQQDLISGEHKYVILGETNAGNLAVVVAKLAQPANWFSSRLGEKPHDLRLLR